MAMQGEFDHPYVPRDMELGGYVPGFLSQSTILAVCGISSLLVSHSCGFYLLIIQLLLHKLYKWRFHKTSKVDRLLMCWWIFTGLIHVLVEGYFVFSPEFYKENTPHYPTEVWKEYSKGDSRYASRDSCVVAIEGITVVIEGPSSLFAVYV
ncbi:hypothetical protein BUALT_Bualt13G0111500 [Buddleja alternifolia]|uniref:EXPERA domain-containing protein n=1 Tax=Buddleja alternifolia TaxID=168488 RepID=A0AAV6WTX1_9LAMI|nr:hypothetical protein BUALT_Bualt13G0111500 [Buddleja alternifolia]